MILIDGQEALLQYPLTAPPLELYHNPSGSTHCISMLLAHIIIIVIVIIIIIIIIRKHG